MRYIRNSRILLFHILTLEIRFTFTFVETSIFWLFVNKEICRWEVYNTQTNNDTCLPYNNGCYVPCNHYCNLRKNTISQKKDYDHFTEYISFCRCRNTNICKANFTDCAVRNYNPDHLFTSRQTVKQVTVFLNTLSLKTQLFDHKVFAQAVL